MTHSIEFALWVSENKHPFNIVEDRGFKKLMKTGPGRPHQYIPSASTLHRDVRAIFASTRQRLASKLQVSIRVDVLSKKNLHYIRTIQE